MALSAGKVSRLQSDGRRQSEDSARWSLKEEIGIGSRGRSCAHLIAGSEHPRAAGFVSLFKLPHVLRVLSGDQVDIVPAVDNRLAVSFGQSEGKRG